MGNTWYGSFVQAEINQIIANFNGRFDPYGPSTSTDAPIIALGESWAYHMGHFLANRKYGGQNIAVVEQRFLYENDFIWDVNRAIVQAQTGLNAHLNLLEDFNPRRTVEDPFSWIPQGLYYDLLDNRNDNNAQPTRVALIDNVSSYTNQQFFDALDADINNLPTYRTRLLNENVNRDAAGVTEIFRVYGYQ